MKYCAPSRTPVNTIMTNFWKLLLTQQAYIIAGYIPLPLSKQSHALYLTWRALNFHHLSWCSNEGTSKIKLFLSYLEMLGSLELLPVPGCQWNGSPLAQGFVHQVQWDEAWFDPPQPLALALVLALHSSELETRITMMQDYSKVCGCPQTSSYVKVFSWLPFLGLYINQ